MSMDRPTCAICEITMTPENSRKHPELFLCDDCWGKHAAEYEPKSEERDGGDTVTTTQRRRREPPITLGGMIPGTHLVRRFQDGRELGPRYIGVAGSYSQRVDAACDEAARAGFRVVEVEGDRFARFDGEWVVITAMRGADHD
jgi:hypothetical protein